MAINFPASPSTNDTHTENGITWIFNGTSWNAQGDQVTAASIGLGNVDNTADANKPVSTATQAALDLKMPAVLASSYGVSSSETAANNTVYLQAAEDAAFSAKAILVLPFGVINIDAAIVLNGGHDRAWAGQGAQLTTLNQTTASEHCVSIVGDHNGLVFERFGMTGVGSPTATGYGLNLDANAAAIDHLVCSQLRIVGFHTGLYGDSISNSRFEGCSLLDNQRGCHIIGNSNSINFDNCAFVDNTTHGLRTQGRGTKVNACDFGGPTQPIQIENHGFMQIIGGNFELYTGTYAVHGVVVSGSTTVIGGTYVGLGGATNIFPFKANNGHLMCLINPDTNISSSGCTVLRSGVPKLSALGSRGYFSASGDGAANRRMIPLWLGGQYRDAEFNVLDDTIGPAMVLRTGLRASGRDDAGLYLPKSNNVYFIGATGGQTIIAGKSSNAPVAIATGKAGVTQALNHLFYPINQLALGVTGMKIAGTTIASGAGTPEGLLSANVGSTYHRTDGGAGTSFYVKESGTGNTGWVAK